MLTDRQILILKLVIQLYTQTLEPIGSATLLKMTQLGVSSATVRNEMMRLEELGYLEKFHASSGRIPSNKGYRYYLDHILPSQPLPLVEPVRHQIRASLQRPGMDLQDLFHISADILANLTSYTTFTIGPQVSQSTLTGFRLVRLSANQVMAILVTDKGLVENKVFAIPESVQEEDLERIVKIMNDELVGLALDQVIVRLKQDLPRLMQVYLKKQIQVLATMKDLLTRFEEERTHVAGKRYLLNFIETYGDINRLKDIYQIMEDNHVLHEMIQSPQKGISIRLGAEMDNPILGDFSLITASYDTPHQESGVIAVLGPRNMPYQNVLAIVQSMREELSQSIAHYYQKNSE